MLFVLFMIPQVKAVTSDQVLYGDKTVTEALDELNVCATSGNATSGDILSGKTAYVQGKLVTGTMPTLATTGCNNTECTNGHADATMTSYGAKSSNDSTGYLYLGLPKNTYTGNNAFLRASANEVATAIGLTGAKIIPGNTVLGVSSTVASKTAATYTPGTSNQTISAGQYLSGAQTIKGDSHLIPEALRCGVTIFGVTGTDGCGTYGFKAKVGDYVKMTPTKTSYSIATSLTGYSSAQTINPSELNLWRIIKLNSDGTIEMVSEYISSTVVYFQGQAAYKKLVGSLNTIANQYANSTYTTGTRHMGYDNQTANLSVTLSASTCKNSTTVDNSLETKGCGDVGHNHDLNLVKAAMGTLKANKVTATTTATSYWLASRHFYYASSTEYSWRGRVVVTDGSAVSNDLYGYNNYGWYTDRSVSYALRPVITLKSGVIPSSGSGSSSSPWVLS